MQNFLDFIIENIWIVLVIILALLGWNIFLQLRLEKTRKRIKIFFKGRKTKDLEEVFAEQIKKVKKNEKEIENLLKWNDKLQKVSDISIQKIGVVRFNPFKDTGGNQSFAIAILDSNNNGFILSSLYSRGGTRVYAKPIKNAVSSYHLSKEEEEAIKKAIL